MNRLREPDEVVANTVNSLDGVEIETLYKVSIDYPCTPDSADPSDAVSEALSQFVLDDLHMEHEPYSTGGFISYTTANHSDAYQSAVTAKGVLIRMGLVANDPTDPLCECDNCGFICHQSMLDPDMADLTERMDIPLGHPDSVEPDGECPVCGCLSYEIEPTKEPS